MAGQREDEGQLGTSTPDHEADTVERLVGRPERI